MGLHTYKFQLTQELKVNDHRQCCLFADWASDYLEEDPNFGRKIIFSEEVHFWMLTSTVAIYGTMPIHMRFTRWQCIHKSYCLVQILGRLHYWSILFWKLRWWGHHCQWRALQNNDNRFLLSQIERYGCRFHVVPAGWCYGPHSGRRNGLLHERFQAMVISRRSDMNWPPRSCNLTTLDFFLWGFLKSQDYVNKLQSTSALKANITSTIAQIQPDLCGRVIENWTTGICAIVRSHDGHLNDVIFHT